MVVGIFFGKGTFKVPFLFCGGVGSGVIGCRTKRRFTLLNLIPDFFMQE